LKATAASAAIAATVSTATAAATLPTSIATASTAAATTLLLAHVHLDPSQSKQTLVGHPGHGAAQLLQSLRQMSIKEQKLTD
jgi:hypothetical protein